MTFHKVLWEHVQTLRLFRPTGIDPISLQECLLGCNPLEKLQKILCYNPNQELCQSMNTML